MDPLQSAGAQLRHVLRLLRHLLPRSVCCFVSHLIIERNPS